MELTKELIAEAGMELTDEEMDQVAGRRICYDKRTEKGGAEI